MTDSAETDDRFSTKVWPTEIKLRKAGFDADARDAFAPVVAKLAGT